ncbi:SAF domain-containing protein [Amycolatopsis sp. NPDC059657]|uniref:SAF domain-containing protein n=1 Tax=Amycolatopsis sp. NPDC059657 TaxID=3346899 RepID=UPI00366B445B
MPFSDARPAVQDDFGSSSAGEGPRRLPRVPRRRRPWLIVTAVVLAAVAGYGNYALLSAQDERVPILVLARTVAWGHTITDADLAIAQTVPDAAAHTVPATRRAAVVGKTATGTLHAGRVLATDDVAAQVIPGAGQRVIGLLCKPGQLPARGLTPGDLVQVSPAAQPGSDRAPGGAAFQARVTDVGASDPNGAVTVDLLVGADAAGAAVAAASGGVVVALLGPGGA